MRLQNILIAVCLALLAPTSGVLYASWVSAQQNEERTLELNLQARAERRAHEQECGRMFPRGEVNRRKCVEGTL